MICFKDMTFCVSKCANTKCERNFTEELHDQAVAWWGSTDFPVCFADFQPFCDAYEEPVEQQDAA